MSVAPNDRLLRALLHQPVDATPVWIMRQAGRYLPEYRELRERAGSFINLCKTPELACEATLQPLQRFPLDAAILFSDILTIPDAMGLGLYFSDSDGPRFQHTVSSRSEISKLAIPDPHQELHYVIQAVRMIRHELDGRIPLIGFAGSPWTLATYMIEGGSSKEFTKIKTLMYDQPKLLALLLEKLTQSVTCYLNAQVAAGAQALMIFDTWGGALTRESYLQFSLHPMTEVVHQLDHVHAGQRVPIILFTKGGGAWLEDMAASGCDALGLDWTVSIDQARARVGDRVALQGNLDPSVLYASPDIIRSEVVAILNRYGHGTGHVFNLGHGINQHVNPEHVAVLVDTVHEASKAFH